MANIKTIYLKSKSSLKEHILKKLPTIYVSSQTSTVIPYDKIEDFYKDTKGDLYLADLTGLPKKMILKGDDIYIEGPVTWGESADFLKEYNREWMTYPTEQSATVLGGIATSATGEQSFSYGTIRDQLVECRMINHKGDEKLLKANKKLETSFDLSDYQKSYNEYENFKNAPFPRFEKEVDFAIGLEGQLGVLTAAQIKTVEKKDHVYFFIALEKWEKDFSAHIEIYQKIQEFRSEIIFCELLDSNALRFLENPPVKDKDLIVLKIDIKFLDKVFEQFISKLKLVSEDSIFEIGESKFYQMRVEIPRNVNEANAREGVLKKGTDIQFKKIEDLFQTYSELKKIGIEYNLFGHFGDAHLHFNFRPKKDEVKKCEEILSSLYKDLQQLGVSPFAEHGIGLIKKDFIKDYLPESVLSIFKKIKEENDPGHIFFPKGFLNKEF